MVARFPCNLGTKEWCPSSVGCASKLQARRPVLAPPTNPNGNEASYRRLERVDIRESRLSLTPVPRPDLHRGSSRQAFQISAISRGNCSSRGFQGVSQARVKTMLRMPCSLLPLHLSTLGLLRSSFSPDGRCKTCIRIVHHPGFFESRILCAPAPYFPVGRSHLVPFLLPLLSLSHLNTNASYSFGSIWAETVERLECAGGAAKTCCTLESFSCTLGGIGRLVMYVRRHSSKFNGCGPQTVKQTKIW